MNHVIHNSIVNFIWGNGSAREMAAASRSSQRLYNEVIKGQAIVPRCESH